MVKYRGTDTNVSVPDTVEIVGEGAFEDNTRVELVVLPNSVKRIEAYAFWGCDNLDTVVLGRGLTEVGDYAFAGCKGLEQMSIPSNVISIGIQAFGDCVNMTDISIPAETLYIHESAFDGCARLTIHCDAGTAADTFAQAFYEKQKEMAEYEDVPEYQPEDEQQSGVTVIVPEPEPDPTAAPAPASEGDILGSTSVVGNRAVLFLDTGELHVLEGAPEHSVEEGVSSGIADLAQILGSMLSIGSVEGLPKYTVVDGRIIADQAFYRNTSLGEVALPEGTEEIGQFSFARSSLTGIEVPDGVTKIGYGAFYHCDNLVWVELPDSVMKVEPKAFEYTAWVEDFRNSGAEFLISGGVLVAYAGEETSVSVPGGVRVIAAEVFAGHEEIQSVKLPDSLLVVGEGAFENCTGLKRVNFGEGVEQIHDRAFAGCDSLEALSLPESLQSVGLQAFGEAEAVYQGNAPEHTYELSATRLSNESFRGIEQENSAPGVTVTGENPATARLEGAVRSYSLTVIRTEDMTDLKTAWRRALESDLPDNTVAYDLQLTDSSGIPIQKLGHSGLTVVLPVPEKLLGQELKLVTLDRNGQLETLAVERVTLEGKEAFRFRTTHLSVFGIYGTGAAEGDVLMEVSVDLSSMSAAPSEKEDFRGAARLVIGAAMLFTGLAVFLSGMGKKKARQR